MSPYLLASAFAKTTYSGDDTQYWGGAAVKARRNLFANASASDASWSNLDAFRCAATSSDVPDLQLHLLACTYSPLSPASIACTYRLHLSPAPIAT